MADHLDGMCHSNTQTDEMKVAWWKLAFNPSNIAICLVLAFSALLAFVQGYAQNLQVDPPKLEHLRSFDIDEILLEQYFY